MATGKLKEVEDDAVRITSKRFRDQEEERQYQISKKEADNTDIPVPVAKDVRTEVETSTTPETKEDSSPKKGK